MAGRHRKDTPEEVKNFHPVLPVKPVRKPLQKAKRVTPLETDPK